MTFFSDQIEQVGNVLTETAGTEAVYIQKDTTITVPCVPVRRQAEYLSEGMSIKMELQDFYIHRHDLVTPDGHYLIPHADDKIQLGQEVFQVVGGKQTQQTDTPPVESFLHTGSRYLIHTVRIKKWTVAS